MIRTTDIHSLTDFTRNAKSYIRGIKETKNPIAITINGEAEVVVQDAAAYQSMIDELEHNRFAASLRTGLKELEEGKVQDLDAAFDEIRKNIALQSPNN